MTDFALGPTADAIVGMRPGLGCQACELLELCGGTFSGFDCFASCCNEPDKCVIACPRSHGFVDVIQDAGGLDMRRHWNIVQRGSRLPLYIPLIHNGSSRSKPLASPYAALTTFDVVSPDMERLFSGPDDLRDYFRVSRGARILLLSVGKDNRLEQYWRWSAARCFAQYLSGLGVDHVTAPNFSFPRNATRPEHLTNRMRSLKSAEQMSAAGLSVIPHVNAYNQTDWDCWRDFLRDHPQITLVVQEFQTGLASRTKASWHIWQMCNIQQSLGRGLHLVAVGGRRHLPLLVGLHGLTVVDSVPFIKACKRRVLDRMNGKWIRKTTGPNETIDVLLFRNLTGYVKAIEATPIRR